MLFLPEYLDHLRLKGASDHTLRSYESDLRTFAVYLDQVNPAKITADDFRAWDTFVRFKYHHNTRVRRRTAISGFFKWLHETEGIPDITADLPPLRSRESDPFLLYPEELEQILHAQDEKNQIQQRDGALISFLATTGVRRGEVIKLRMADVSLSPTGQCWIVNVPSGKPEGRNRRVNFGNIEAKLDIATGHFGLWFMKRIEQFGGATASSRYPLFSDSAEPSKALGRSAIENSIIRACRRANLPRLFVGAHGDAPTSRDAVGAHGDAPAPTPTRCSVSCHTFRHFFATYARVHGMDLEVISSYLGHASLNTTRRYIHLAEKASSEQMLRSGPTRGLHAKPTLDHSEFTKLLHQIVPRSRS